MFENLKLIALSRRNININKSNTQSFEKCKGQKMTFMRNH